MERRRAAKVFHETVGRGIAEVKGFIADRKLARLKTWEAYRLPSPVYISQIADAERPLISGFYGEIKDEKAAKKFGTDSLGEFSYWSWRSCGIVALEMVFKTVFGKKFDKTTMDLVKEGYQMGGYDIKNDIGWFHETLAKLAEKYGLKAEVKKFIPSSEIALLLLKNQYLLASIRSDTGGHLLLVYGFKLARDRKLEGFWVHDPNNYEKNGKGKYIKNRDFNKIFTRRVISLEHQDN